MFSVLGIGMGPTDNFLDMLDTPQDHGFLEQLEEKLPERLLTYIHIYIIKFHVTIK